jgi:hypothetical protein
VTSVAFERSVAGANTWVSICTDNATPYTCSFNTAALADGSYDLRARAVDGAGNQTSSVATRLIDNNTPSGTAVATGNGGTTAGLLEAGDWITFTWSEPMAPASILTGWTGTSQAIRVTVANNGNNDRMDFYNAAGTTRLNLINSATDLQLGANFVTGTVWFNATMVQTGSSITVTLGSYISGTTVTAGNGTISWRPSSSAKDLAGKSSTTTTVTETGGADRDF